eukprot:10875915-Alexandrium_andersonii.AAC.1
MPLLEGHQFKPEYAGYAHVQVAVRSAAASAMPERLLGNLRILESEGSRNCVRYFAADGGRFPNLGEARSGFPSKEQH